MLAFYLSLIDDEAEHAKFTKLYRRYRRLMKYTAYIIVRNVMDAEDIVQEAFIRITRYIARIEISDKSRTRALVCVITRRIAFDTIKIEKRHPTVSVELVGEIPGNAVDALSKMAAQEILELIKELPEIYREVLMLKAYYELTDKQLAGVLGISHGALRKRLERARTALLESMAKKGGNYAYERV